MAIVSGSISYYDTTSANGLQCGLWPLDSTSFLLAFRDVESTYPALVKCTVDPYSQDINISTTYSGSRAANNRGGAIQQVRAKPFKLINSYAVAYNDVSYNGGPSFYAVTQSSNGDFGFFGNATTFPQGLGLYSQYRCDYAVVNDTQIAVFGWSAGQTNDFVTPRYFAAGNRLYVFTITGSSCVSVLANGVGGPKQSAGFPPDGTQWLGSGASLGVGLCCVSQSNVTASMVGAWSQYNQLYAQYLGWASSSGLGGTGLQTGSSWAVLSNNTASTSDYYNAIPNMVCVGENLFLWSYLTGSSTNGKQEIGIARVDPPTRTIIPIMSSSVSNTNTFCNRLAVLALDTGSGNYAKVLSWCTAGNQTSWAAPQEISVIRVDNISRDTTGSLSMSFEVRGETFNNGTTWNPFEVAALTPTRFVAAGWGSFPVQSFDFATPIWPGFQMIGVQSISGVNKISWRS